MHGTVLPDSRRYSKKEGSHVRKMKWTALLLTLLMAAQLTGALAEVPPTELPLATGGETLTVWRPLHSTAAKYITNTGETETAKALEELTGVKVEYIHPAVGQEATAFSLMLASGDYPDIVMLTGIEYPGGGDAAIEDGVFIRLNELIDEYAPHYKALRESTDEKRKMTITDTGNIWAFYHMNDVEEGPFNGMSVRRDWLEELGLEAPVTIEDWYDMLTAFKNEKGAAVPLVMANNATVSYKTDTFMSAYGVTREFILDEDGKVQFGPLLPGYREYIEEMRKWYAEGLIDPDFLTRTNLPYMAYPPMDLVGTNQTGAFPNNWDMTGTYWYAMGVAQDESFYALPVAAPVLAEGDTLHLGFKTYSVSNYAVGITSACENPELAVQWLDYLYSPEGSRTLNFGKEGVTYEMVDGEPRYTDYIAKNEEGITPRDMIISKTFHDGVGLVDYRRFWQVSDTSTLEAVSIWQSNTDFAGVLPTVSLTVAEGELKNDLYPDISTLVAEKTVRYIMGTEPMDTYDDFLAQIESMGIQEVIDVTQAAYDRYLKR